ncbi:iron-containing alcohol dehydrogenase [Motiliproteus sp. MSK22-1]|uniref:iron-containing alcohol dehydrogenase n=1 Tax=Motiliproteus sp. MSK22-1 TaxID=1897630 RepID=UPI000976FC77|nr:iron-containing alcohol dehydrogenase [Motiliproteus sp. MSK22-1]OMH38239.1 alcohol dehydrogenase [Motiliproteus sp. MSK22-1]
MKSDSSISIGNFAISRLPRIQFGKGAFAQLVAEIAVYGKQVLIVTGGKSFTRGPHWAGLKAELKDSGILWDLIRIPGEPSPEWIDQAVVEHRDRHFDVVVGIGGGSPLDAAKAIAGLLPQGNSVMDHLEGVGRGICYTGPSLPYIAVPTTAGTGSEMTKNAVLSSTEGGFKKSFRDEKLTAQLAIIDPDLLASCPREQLIANGMDAFTQLLEAYTSPKSNPITDALAFSGIEYFLLGFSQHSEADLSGPEYLAYGSMISGICLAQTGLGAVHGLASPLGAHFPIPHGVACGTTLAAVTETNIAALKKRQPDSFALDRYARVGRLLFGQTDSDESKALSQLVDTLWRWTEILEIPRLSHYGMEEADISIIVAESGGNSMKTNPLILTNLELEQVLLSRL